MFRLGWHVWEAGERRNGDLSHKEEQEKETTVLMNQLSGIL